ncbi:four-carbon acid sugar kinase family protein [Shouchella patagoniensis]|uniref:four-carbon acid sugar kinase family protein n=1 Tax=Shouchella patagoniensis TaxID=228576 RepID=UPI003F5ABC50
MNELKRYLLGFYGDDFTGSTDAMEALDRYGLKTILFLRIPNKELLNRFRNVDCIGIAGTARAKGLDGMKEELLPIYEFLKTLNPYFVHYKVCSTFDSSPEVGSIGFASDLARNYFNGFTFPLLVAAPNLGRYTIFGNHFAVFNNEVYRLDMHPVMSKHPVTPMNEADLAKHLQEQTNQKVTKVTVRDLETKTAIELIEEEEKSSGITLFDAMNDTHIKKFSEMLWEKRSDQAQFLVGSSGIEYALGDMMKHKNKMDQMDRVVNPSKAEKLFAVSGSVSEVTKMQLDEAEKAGFHLVQIPCELYTDEVKAGQFLETIAQQIEEKKRVVIYTAKGADDPIILNTKKHLIENGVPKDQIGRYIGEMLGIWTKQVLDKVDIRRVIISGGDTSGFVTSNLDIYGLEVLDSIAPGAPLCLAYSESAKYDGLEIALKSGQLGGPAFFNKVFQSGSN